MLLPPISGQKRRLWLRRMDMRRTRQLKITLSEQEYQALARRSEEFGVSMAGVVRSAVLGLPLPKRRSKIDLEAVVALNRVGSNLNQLVKIAHVTGCLSPAQVLAAGDVTLRITGLTRRIQEGLEA